MTWDRASILNKSIFCCGISYKTAPLGLREKLYVPQNLLPSFLPQFKLKWGFEEVFLLSTCNRIECYGVLNNTESLPSSQILGSIRQILGSTDLQPQENLTFNTDLNQHIYFFQDEEAVNHLFSVVSSLESLVVGETQITGQFKEAIKMSSQSETLGPILDRLAQEALLVNKKVRTQTSIGQKTVSISHAAIDLAKKIFGSLEKHKLLVIGAGEMAQVAAQHAISHNIKDIFIANRTISKAQALADQLGLGTAFQLSSSLDDLLVEADLVITATGSKNPLIQANYLKNIMKRRRYKPLFICDIAVPRDVEPQCTKIDDVYLFDVDDLTEIVQANLAQRQACLETSREIVQKHTHHFKEWLMQKHLNPPLEDFKHYVERLVQQEFSKTFEKQIFEDLTLEQHAAIYRMGESIIKKMVADVAKKTKNFKK